MIDFVSAPGVVAESLESPEPFRAWLAQMPAEAPVGLPSSLSVCPIANFLRSRGIEYPAVGPSVVRWDVPRDPRTAPRHELPDWAKRFVERVDRAATSRENISATYALTLLHEVTREVAA